MLRQVTGNHMHCKLHKFCSYGSQRPACQSNQAHDRSSFAGLHHAVRITQCKYLERYLKQTLQNASCAEQKLLVLFQITLLLIQKLAVPQLTYKKTEV